MHHRGLCILSRLFMICKEVLALKVEILLKEQRWIAAAQSNHRHSFPCEQVYDLCFAVQSPHLRSRALVSSFTMPIGSSAHIFAQSVFIKDLFQFFRIIHIYIYTCTLP